MAKIIKQPRDCFDEITADYQGVFGDDLLSVILYGSGTGSDYRPGESDLNFLIILTDAGMGRLGSAMDIVAKWRKWKVAIPLFMTNTDVLSSLDSYPIEFINMQMRHMTVFGEKVMETLSFTPAHLRLQLERETKSKLLHLRSGFLATEGKTAKIKDLIGVSLNAFIALFTALLYLKGATIPHTKRQIIEDAAKTVSMNAAVFLKCADIKAGTGRFSDADIREGFDRYLEEIGRLCDTIDRLEV